MTEKVKLVTFVDDTFQMNENEENDLAEGNERMVKEKHGNEYEILDWRYDLIVSIIIDRKETV